MRFVLLAASLGAVQSVRRATGAASYGVGGPAPRLDPSRRAVAALRSVERRSPLAGRRGNCSPAFLVNPRLPAAKRENSLGRSHPPRPHP